MVYLGATHQSRNPNIASLVRPQCLPFFLFSFFFFWVENRPQCLHKFVKFEAYRLCVYFLKGFALGFFDLLIRVHWTYLCLPISCCFHSSCTYIVVFWTWLCANRSIKTTQACSGTKPSSLTQSLTSSLALQYTHRFALVPGLGNFQKKWVLQNFKPSMQGLINWIGLRGMISIGLHLSFNDNGYANTSKHFIQ